MKNYVFDIETVALPTDQLQAIIPAFDPETVKTGNYGPEKAAEKIEKVRQEQFNRFMRNAALSALTGQVAMIGIRSEAGDTYIFSLPDEKTIIAEWLKLFESEIDRGGHWIGFNISNFDLPFLIRRAWFHRLRIPYGIVRGRYITSHFTDLLTLWIGSEHAGRFEVSLNDLAKFFAIGIKSANGADFGELLRYKPEGAREYLANDLEITWKVAEAMGALKRPLASDLAEPTGPPDPGPAIDPIEEPQSEPAGIQFY
jgi:hypothetical protein